MQLTSLELKVNNDNYLASIKCNLSNGKSSPMIKKKNYCFLHGEEVFFDPFRKICKIVATEFSVFCKHT